MEHGLRPSWQSYGLRVAQDPAYQSLDCTAASHISRIHTNAAQYFVDYYASYCFKNQEGNHFPDQLLSPDNITENKIAVCL